MTGSDRVISISRFCLNESLDAKPALMVPQLPLAQMHFGDAINYFPLELIIAVLRIIIKVSGEETITQI